jgi:hypothetical protein
MYILPALRQKNDILTANYKGDIKTDEFKV